MITLVKILTGETESYEFAKITLCRYLTIQESTILFPQMSEETSTQQKSNTVARAKSTKAYHALILYRCTDDIIAKVNELVNYRTNATVFVICVRTPAMKQKRMESEE